ncbi:hypothetical protein BH09MYX1_BH09MYX1_11160 [soil metagenome]
MLKAELDRVLSRLKEGEDHVSDWRLEFTRDQENGRYSRHEAGVIEAVLKDLEQWAASINASRDLLDAYLARLGFAHVSNDGAGQARLVADNPVDALDELRKTQIAVFDDSRFSPAAVLYYLYIAKQLDELANSATEFADRVSELDPQPTSSPMVPFGGIFLTPPGVVPPSPPPQPNGGGNGRQRPMSSPDGAISALDVPGIAGAFSSENAGPLAINFDLDRGLGEGSIQSVARIAIAKKDHGDEFAFGGPGGGSLVAKLRHGGGGHSGMFALSENNEGLFTHKQRGPGRANVVARNGGGSGGNAGGGKRQAPGPNPAPGRGTSDTKASASEGRVTGSEGRGIRAETTPSSRASSPEVGAIGGGTTATASPTPAPNPPEDRGTGGGGSGSTSGASGSTGTSGNGGGSPNAPSGGGSKGPPQAESKPVETKGSPKKDTDTPKEDPHKRPGGNPNPEDDGTGGGGPRASSGQNESPNPEDSGGGGGNNPRARVSRLVPYDDDGGRRGGTGGGVGGPRAYNAYPDPESSGGGGGGNPRARFEMPNPEDAGGPQGPSARLFSNWRGRML